MGQLTSGGTGAWPNTDNLANQFVPAVRRTPVALAGYMPECWNSCS